MRRLLLAAVFALVGTLPAAADYPTKPIRIVVPYGPGGATDIVARILGEHLKDKLRQPVVVENKPGGNGVVALQEMVRSRPDGYTMLIGNVTTNLLAPLLGDPPTPFDPFRDLIPVARLVDVPGVFLATKVNFPPNTVQEVVDYARARPGEINHNTAGILAYSHIDFLMLQKRTGIKLVAVPLRAGAGGGQIDLINGAVHIAMQNAATVDAAGQGRQAQGAGGHERQRLAVLPDVPTMKEAGFEGIGTNAWQSCCATDMPKDILDVVAKAVARDADADKAVQQLKDLQFTVIPTRTAEEAQAWLRQEEEPWKPIVAEAKAMVKKQ